MCEPIAHSVDPAALVRRVVNAPCGSAQHLVIVGNNSLDAAQAAIRQRPRANHPEGFGLGGSKSYTEDRATTILVHRVSYNHDAAMNAAAQARFDLGGVQLQRGPRDFT